MDTLAPRRPSTRMPDPPAGWQQDSRLQGEDRHATHEFLTHDQRPGNSRELRFDDLDPRERSIFLRCGFRAPA